MSDCQICRQPRPEDCLFVLLAPIHDPASVTRVAPRRIIKQSIRYCADSDECAAGANWYLWSGGCVPWSQLARDVFVKLATERWLAGQACA